MSEQAGFDHHMVKPVDPRALMKYLAGMDVLRGAGSQIDLMADRAVTPISDPRLSR